VLVGGGLPEEAMDVVAAEAERLGCELGVVEVADGDEPRARNEALARASLDLLASRGHLPPAGSAVVEALRRLRIAGRDDRRGDVIFDGAHTVRAAASLARRLPSLDVGAVVFGCTEGRDAVAMARSLAAATPHLVLTRAPGERGVDPASLAAALDAAAGVVEVVDDPVGALERARGRSGSGRRILVTGSLYLVGHLLPEATPTS